ncbi:MAG: sulfatase [Flavobacteriales bacterium]|nr:sulfatase [Flavobacteriales bacterium]
MLKILLLFLVLPLNSLAQNNKNIRPNFVFFLVDDLGYSDVGCYGSDYYKTPNIDKLAYEGVRFTNAYASGMVCSPSRASILTGKYPARLRITTAIPIKGYARIKNGTGTPLMDADYTMNLPLEELTIAEVLKNNGYSTSSIGKWHVCKDSLFFPQNQGFDENIGGSGRGHSANYFYPYYGKWRMAEGHPWIEWNTVKGGKPGDYLTDRLTIDALNFIEKNKNKPFFLYLSHYAVHTPIQVKEKTLLKYKDAVPDKERGHIYPKYAAMIESVDQSLGSIVKKLEQLNLTDNTIIIFTSDNGGHGKWTSNYPFKGNKGNFYEGGIRVPLIFKWSKKIKSSQIIEDCVIGNDFYPTLLEMAEIPLIPNQHIDGISLWSLLNAGKKIDRNELFWHFPNYIGAGHPDPARPSSVIRSGKWKLIENLENGEVELYDLKNDISEKNDISKKFQKKVVELKNKLNNWRIDVNAQMPLINENFSP